MNADGPGRPEAKAPRPPQRGRNRTFASWNDCCKPGGPLDREDDAFDQSNGLGEYSEDKCGYDGFYQAETHWTSRRTGHKYVRVQTKSLRAQELEAQRQPLPGGAEYEATARSYAATRAAASTLPAPHTAPPRPVAVAHRRGQHSKGGAASRVGAHADARDAALAVHRSTRGLLRGAATARRDPRGPP
eukprot:4891899-Prymnesium_polylepis.1